MSIRELSGGRLMVSEAPSATRLRRSLLPPPEEDDNSCMASGGRHCFLAGDERVNEQPMLTALHTVMVREHNRLARALQTEVPDASDEELYQAARQIVGGLMQKITYHEYLPNVVGPELYTGESFMYCRATKTFSLPKYSTLTTLLTLYLKLLLTHLSTDHPQNKEGLTWVSRIPANAKYPSTPRPGKPYLLGQGLPQGRGAHTISASP